MKRISRLSLIFLLLLAPAAHSAQPQDAQVQSTELQKMVQAQEERLARLEAQLQSKGLLNLLNEVEELKAEVARLRGTMEEQANLIATGDKRTKDLFADLDDRVKALAERPEPKEPKEPEVVHLQVSPALVTPPVIAGNAESETKAYEAAHGLIKSGRYKEAIAAMQDFLKQYPNAALAPNAVYWTGFSYVGMSDFKNAAVNYQRLLKDYPNSPKAPDAMLSLARARVQMNDIDEARTTLQQLIEKFPYSKAADGGKKLLATLQ